MNEERRIKIKTLCSRLESLARDLVSSDAEKAVFEATPTGLQSSNRETDSDSSRREIATWLSNSKGSGT